jgi:hypothetical protein
LTENRGSVHNLPAVFPERGDTADGQEVVLVEKDLPSPVGVQVLAERPGQDAHAILRSCRSSVMIRTSFP